MKRIIKTVIPAILMAAVSSCTFVRVNPNAFDFVSDGGSSTRVTASSTLSSIEYNVPDFDKMDIYLPAEVTYEMTEGEPSVYVYGPENLMEYLHFEVEDGKLQVRYSENIRTNSIKELDIAVKSSTLKELNILGAGDVDILNELVCDSFAVAVKGAGDVEINTLKTQGNVDVRIQGAGDVDIENVECDKVTALIQGAGDVDVAGKANSADLTIQGAGDIDISRLQVEDVSSRVQGMGEIRRP